MPFPLLCVTNQDTKDAVCAQFLFKLLIIGVPVAVPSLEQNPEVKSQVNIDFLNNVKHGLNTNMSDYT
jgi:hypothetical protein